MGKSSSDDNTGQGATKDYYSALGAPNAISVNAVGLKTKEALSNKQIPDAQIVQNLRQMLSISQKCIGDGLNGLEKIFDGDNNNEYTEDSVKKRFASAYSKIDIIVKIYGDLLEVGAALPRHDITKLVNDIWVGDGNRYRLNESLGYANSVANDITSGTPSESAISLLDQFKKTSINALNMVEKPLDKLFEETTNKYSTGLTEALAAKIKECTNHVRTNGWFSAIKDEKAATKSLKEVCKLAEVVSDIAANNPGAIDNEYVTKNIVETLIRLEQLTEQSAKTKLLGEDLCINLSNNCSNLISALPRAENIILDIKRDLNKMSKVLEHNKISDSLDGSGLGSLEYHTPRTTVKDIVEKLRKLEITTPAQLELFTKEILTPINSLKLDDLKLQGQIRDATNTVIEKATENMTSSKEEKSASPNVKNNLPAPVQNAAQQLANALTGHVKSSVQPVRSGNNQLAQSTPTKPDAGKDSKSIS
jgi:hypothetical protein